MYPDAPIFTSYCTDEWRDRLDNQVVTGYLQRWPFAKLRKFLPVLRQRWFRSLDLSEFDLVISSSGNGEAKFVRVKKPAIHICYCHTPTHFYWRKYTEYLKNPSFKPKWLARLGLRTLVKPLRKKDYEAAQRVDYFIANSSHIQNDIKKYYDRDSVVIHPPVDTESFSPISPRTSSRPTTSFITWGRHVPYKRFDLAIQACNELKLPLVITGRGPETPYLKKIAGPTITFKGFVSHAELVALSQEASAFIFPGEEDFGLSPVEAMALGLPVIAYKSGGALDYVAEGKTGVFFEHQTVNALVDSLRKFKLKKYSAGEIGYSAKQFSSQEFKLRVDAFIRSLT